MLPIDPSHDAHEIWRRHILELIKEVKSGTGSERTKIFIDLSLTDVLEAQKDGSIDSEQTFLQCFHDKFSFYCGNSVYHSYLGSILSDGRLRETWETISSELNPHAPSAFEIAWEEKIGELVKKANAAFSLRSNAKALIADTFQAFPRDTVKLTKNKAFESEVDFLRLYDGIIKKQAAVNADRQEADSYMTDQKLLELYDWAVSQLYPNRVIVNNAIIRPIQILRFNATESRKAPVGMEAAKEAVGRALDATQAYAISDDGAGTITSSLDFIKCYKRYLANPAQPYDDRHAILNHAATVINDKQLRDTGKDIEQLLYPPAVSTPRH